MNHLELERLMFERQRDLQRQAANARLAEEGRRTRRNAPAGARPNPRAPLIPLLRRVWAAVFSRPRAASAPQRRRVFTPERPHGPLREGNGT